MDHEFDEDQLSIPDGVYPITLKENAQKRLGCVANWDVSSLETIKTCPIQALLEESKEYPNSDLGKLSSVLKSSKIDDAYIIYDTSLQFGSEFMVCLSEQAKFRFKQIEEDRRMALVDKNTDYVYQSPTPRKWNSLGSEKEIEQDWVKDSRSKIQILVKRSVARNGYKSFSDRNVEDIMDGYVVCMSYTDSSKWGSVRSMERGMQAVSVLVDNSSQTELKYPKNTYCQYESRIFSVEEIEAHWESEEMKEFMRKVTNIIDEIIKDPDIMGEFKEDINRFYKRDEIKHVEQTEMIETMAFSDLTFTQKMKVNHIRWHPCISGVVAMSVMEDSSFSAYNSNSSDRTIKPNYLLIWSEAHPIFPQILLRLPDDITKFEWHPNEPDILVGGCFNGQVIIWDIGIYLLKLKTKVCIWRYDVVLTDSGAGDKLHVQDGFIPVLNWSAESAISASHSFMVEDLKWFPSNVKFTPDSAYPQINDNEGQRQFLTCSSGDGFVLVWGFEDLTSEEEPSLEIDGDNEKTRRGLNSASVKIGWEKIRQYHGLKTQDLQEKPKRKTMAIGKYKHLDQILKPIHKISFILPQFSVINDEVQKFRIQITSVSIVSRVELMKFEKESSKESEESMENTNTNDLNDDDGNGETNKSNKGHRGSIDKNYSAMPLDFVGGSFLGGIFKADLSKVKVEVESGELQCKIEWSTMIHDGPVKCIERSPFNKDILLSIGGYSIAIWKDIEISKPVILHFVEYEEEFTQAVWSPTRPSVYFLAGHLGNFQAWLVMLRKSAPFFKQNISGKAITAICPHECKKSGNKYMSVGDSTGTLRMLTLPKELWESEENELDEFEKYISREIELIREKNKKISEQSSNVISVGATFDLHTDDETIKPWSNPDEFWKDYFEAEKALLVELYGVYGWRSHAKDPDKYRRVQYLPDFEENDRIPIKSKKAASAAINAFKSSGLARISKLSKAKN